MIPFSSMHKYQRTDSAWGNKYICPLKEYGTGFSSPSCELTPPFMRYDCVKQSFEEINPAETPDGLVDPLEFGDDWSELLEKRDVERIGDYFRSIAHLSQIMDFVTFRVGNKDNVIELRNREFHKGIVFQVPRRSLMRAIRYEIFDDLLIGNFMRTTLVGKWPSSGLYPDFTPYVAKYADNGRAKSVQELERYFGEYRHRAAIDYLRHRLKYRMLTAARTRIEADSKLYQLSKKAWSVASRRSVSL